MTAPESTPAVRTAGLTKYYASRAVVDGIALELPSGVISGFVGPNGAGKTTTLRMLLGLVRPSAGTGEVLGRPITDPASYLPWVGSLIEAPAFYPMLSGRRNLEILATLGGHDAARVGDLLDHIGLADRADDHFSSYSMGMKQRLGIAAALLPDPELLVLDEPTNGLDPAGIREVRVLLRQLADDGLTILVSSHRLEEIQTICDHLVIIDDGRIRFQGPIEDLLGDQTAEIVATPEHPADLPRLAALCAPAGYPTRVLEGCLHVAAPAQWSPILNRLATQSGITLATLSIAHGSLEDAFFAMTDHGPADGPADPVPAPATGAETARTGATTDPHRIGGGRIPGVFASEVLKLRRTGLILGGGGVLLAFTALVTVLGLVRATGAAWGQLVRPLVIAELSRPDGLVLGLKRGGPLMGIVVLGIFAAAFGTEYSTGALRNLLVREPRRIEFLTGKYLALLVFGVMVVLAAAAVSVAIAFAMAPARGIDTSAWASAAGASAVWTALWHLIVAALGFGTLGAALAIVLRSPVAALAVGVAWILPAEAILSAAWADGQYWLPGQLLQTLAIGGTTAVPVGRALMTLAVYWIVIAVGTAVLFTRRDIAA